MKLYGYFRSSAAYRARIACNLKGLTVEHIAVHLREGAQRRSEFLARNPQGLVPALELDDGTVLTQSLAIMEYLDAIKPEPRLVPADLLQAAKVRAAALAIACDIHPLNNSRVQRYLVEEMAQDQATVDRWVRHWVLKGGLEAVEQMIEPGPFCFGAAPTMADVCLIPQLFNARRADTPLDGLPKILAVDAACAELAAFRDAHPARQADAE
jgi:maleylacetoacetate isomerase